ncbi:YrzI family small protein [Bacillus sp. B1-b2]|nr:YrzI family small protein [Bacillus sp. B1-b2]KAB7667258.1 YrzI family small protein [Bacillus sp. B1-b2]
MTLNIFFITITINRKKMSQEEHSHLQEIERIMEENKRKYLDSSHSTRYL